MGAPYGYCLLCAVRVLPAVWLQSFIQVFTLAFLVVGATCVAMIPIMLYMLQLQKYGWNWIHACMFGAMIASTDAVAIVSIMKTSKQAQAVPGVLLGLRRCMMGGSTAYVTVRRWLLCLCTTATS